MQQEAPPEQEMPEAMPMEGAAQKESPEAMPMEGAAGKETPEDRPMGNASPPEPMVPENPCESVFEDLAAKARSTMKTVYGTCQEKRVEANPMWSMHYDGTVRIRVLDGEGNVVEMQERKP